MPSSAAAASRIMRPAISLFELVATFGALEPELARLVAPPETGPHQSLRQNVAQFGHTSRPHDENPPRGSTRPPRRRTKRITPGGPIRPPNGGYSFVRCSADAGVATRGQEGRLALRRRLRLGFDVPFGNPTTVVRRIFLAHCSPIGDLPLPLPPCRSIVRPRTWGLFSS